MNEENNVYAELMCKTFKYFEEHPMILLGVGLSAGVSIMSTCAIMTTCIMIENKKGVN